MRWRPLWRISLTCQSHRRSTGGRCRSRLRSAAVGNSSALQDRACSATSERTVRSSHTGGIGRRLLRPAMAVLCRWCIVDCTSAPRRRRSRLCRRTRPEAAQRRRPRSWISADGRNPAGRHSAAAPPQSAGHEGNIGPPPRVFKKLLASRDASPWVPGSPAGPIGGR